MNWNKMRPNYLTRITLGLVILLFVKCKSASLPDIVKRRYIDNCDSTLKTSYQDSLYLSKRYTAVLKYNYELALREISGYVLGSQYGHDFKFNALGYLKYYKFIVDGVHYSYGVFYEDETSNYSEIGTPAVDYMDNVKADEKGNNYHFLFSSFPRERIKISYSPDGKSFYKTDQKESKLMPFLSQVSLEVPSSVKIIYFKMETAKLIKEFPGLEDSKIFLDSVVLK